MHVLVIPSWFARYPGDPSGSFFATQAAGVQQQGDEVGIIYPDLRPVFQIRQYLSGKTEYAVDNGVRILRHTYINWTPRIESLIMPKWLNVGMRLFDEYCTRFGKPDVVHAHCFLRAGVLASKIFGKHHIPYVVTEHSSQWHKHEVTGRELQMAREAANNAKAIISVSGALLSHMHQDLALNKTHVLPNAVDSIFLSGGIQQRPAGQNIAFINIGLLNPGKRQDLLIDAFYLAFGSDTKNTLTIVGDGPERKALEARIARYRMEASIRLLGMRSRNEVVNFLEDSDCLALTSDHETFGVVVIEALAKGVPVISTDCGGTSEIVTSQNGILTEKGNVQAIAAAMSAMSQRINTGVYDRNRIREDCANKFSQQSVCSGLQEIYKEVTKLNA